MGSGLFCPSCGVPVVSGYVRCPKCHAALPYGSGRIKRTTVEPGGTAVDSGGGFPWAAVIVAVVVAAGIALFFGFRGGGKKVEPTTTPAEPVAGTAAPAPPPTAGPAPNVASPAQPVEAPSPHVLGAELDRQLKRQRLWSNVTVSGDRVDVRSQSCGDPQMKPALDAGTAGFHAAGLTKLRCMEQSGRVVFERDL
jgi:hypothetical protein